MRKLLILLLITVVGSLAPVSESKAVEAKIAKTIPDVNQVWATMANMNGDITIAYQEKGKSGYKTCKVPKSQPIVIRCYPGGKTEGKETQNDLFSIWEDSHSFRFAPVDGRCDLRVSELDDFGGQGKYDCVDEDCNQTDSTPYYLCGTKTGVIQIGSQGVQVVMGKKCPLQANLLFPDTQHPGAEQ